MPCCLGPGETTTTSHIGLGQLAKTPPRLGYLRHGKQTDDLTGVDEIYNVVYVSLATSSFDDA
jgi:hypothetical protein